MSEIDFIGLKSWEIYDLCQDNAERWAEAFCQYAKSVHPGYEIDKGWMIGWFANAIECSSQFRRARDIVHRKGIENAD